ncbi:hypothetical protein HDU82_004904 [Entophlyctis luteolus]|nr:hypothetical protein HDU82_004904 [Entophlyctis luteolus]
MKLIVISAAIYACANAYSVSQSDILWTASTLASHISGKGGCLFALPDSPEFPSRNLAALWLQAVFHDAGTWDAHDGTGGLNGSIETDAEASAKANKAIIPALATRAVGGQRKMSDADVIALGGVVSLETCGGPKIDFWWGREDATVCDDFAALPTDPNLPVAALQMDFDRMGLSPVDMLALVSGSHSLGGAHADVSGATTAKFAQFDSTPDVFDNEIFKRILGGDCVLAIDCAFGKEEHLRPYIQKWADDKESFFEQYKISFEKLLGFGKWGYQTHGVYV